MYSRWTIGIGVFVGALALAGCNKVKRLAGEAAERSAKADDAEESSVTAQPELVPTGAAGPNGMSWERAEQPGIGSVELPAGEGWTKEKGSSLQVSNEKLDISVMVQGQSGVPAEARKEYLASLVDVNKRDAPKYEVTSQSEGGVKNVVAGRVDGKFDNGTAYATRDYVLFAKNSALALMVRGPATQAAAVQGIADRIAVSFR